MITTPDGVVIYSEEDLQSARSTEYAAGYERGKGTMHKTIGKEVLAWFKAEVANDDMNVELALNTYNKLAEAIGWETVDSLTTKYTVCVNYNDMTIGQFEDVEAEDEDSAIEEVRDNLEVDDVELSITLSYNGQQHRDSVNMTYEFDSDELEFEATEQD
jgi:hypothetical protein